jgi:hypothetical protein
MSHSKEIAAYKTRFLAPLEMTKAQLQFVTVQSIYTSHG